jgi:acetyl-CoA carboxylase, biotin carboxylase subunit
MAGINKIRRILIANRGEIAVRIIRACKSLGIEAVAAVSEADRESLPARMADRAVCIGPPRSTESYLNVGAIIMAALGTKSDAIHPGYGFLAEQVILPEACARYGLLFIGPTADNIRKMGDKLLARKIAKELGLPLIPGSELVSDLQEISAAAEKIGYPVLLKAAAGGGGRGMKIARQSEDLQTIFHTATAEAGAAFGDPRVYVEHYIANARHVEVQVLGDRFGHLIHLGERDCSLQRRYQKLVEEAPSPVVSAELRKKICEAAVRITSHIRYENAGTVEFILDQDRQEFYFLEMNTRIQVEHPVTEMVTGVDLVQEQIRIAAGEPLQYSQEKIVIQGHAIECRINAESPQDGFRPCPGVIREWVPPQGPGIRIDSHCFPGYRVPPYYDSLLAKTITAGESRREAIDRMGYALDRFTISGIDTTIPIYRAILKHADYLNARVNTSWVENVLLKEYAGSLAA